MYLVENSESGETKEEALAWQQEFQDLFADDADSYSDTFTVVYFTGRSIDDALEESVTGEIFLFITTCAFLLNHPLVESFINRRSCVLSRFI